MGANARSTFGIATDANANAMLRILFSRLGKPHVGPTTSRLNELLHTYMSLDGVIDEPTWTFDYGFDPQMGEDIGAITERSRGILLGRTTYEMFEPAWSTRTVEDDPGAPFFNDTTKYVVSATLTTATWRNSKIIGRYDPDAIRSPALHLLCT